MVGCGAHRGVGWGAPRVGVPCPFYPKILFWGTSYMQKTCDVAEMAILAKKIAEKVRKSRQNVNRDKSA